MIRARSLFLRKLAFYLTERKAKGKEPLSFVVITNTVKNAEGYDLQQHNKLNCYQLWSIIKKYCGKNQINRVE